MNTEPPAPPSDLRADPLGSPDESLDSASSGVNDLVSLEPGASAEPTQVTNHLALRRKQRRRLIILSCMVVALVGFTVVTLAAKKPEDKLALSTGEFNRTSVPLNGIPQLLNTDTTPSLRISGQLQVSNSVIVQPTTQPTSPTIGQMYLDKTTNRLRYYDGTKFVDLGSQVSTITTNNFFTQSSAPTILLQASSPGTTQTGNINISGKLLAGSLQGDGSGLTNLSASSLTSGTVSGSLLSGAYGGITGVGTLSGLNVSGNGSFGGTVSGADAVSNNQFVTLSQLNGATGGAGVNSLNTLAGGLTLQGTAGQLSVSSNGTNTLTLALDSSVTLQGNSFNGAGQLVQLNGSGFLPALNASALTNLNASSLASGTVPTGVVSGNYGNVTGVGTLGSLNVTSTGTFGSTVSGADATSNNQFVTLSQLNTAIGGVGSGVGSLNTLVGGLTLQGTSGHVSVASNGTDTLTLDLDSSVTLQGNSFNGVSQLVKLDGSGNLPALNGSALTNLNASNLATGTVGSGLLSGAYTGITQVGTLSGLGVTGNGAFSGTVSGADAVGSTDFVTLSQLNGVVGGISAVTALNSLTGGLTLQGTAGQLSVSSNGTDTLTLALDSSVTVQGNSFNGVSQLVKLNGSGQLPAIDASLLTSLNASNLASGTVANGRLSGAYTGVTGVGTLGSLSVSGTATLGAANVTNNLGVGGNITVSGTGAFTGTVSGADASASNEYVTLSQLTGAVGGVTPDLQAAYDNSSSPATIGLSSTNKGITIKDAASTVGGNLFAVQNNAGSTSYLAITTSGASVGGNIVVSGGGTFTNTVSGADAVSSADFVTLSQLNTAVGGAGGGVTNIGTIDTGTYSDNGGSISGATIFLQSASATHTGLVTHGTQTFGGDKTFGNNVVVTGGLTAATLQGDGSAITNLNASNLASGTVSSSLLTGAYTGITQVGTLSGLNVTGTGAFSSTVSGADAVGSTDFVTLSQLNGAIGGVGGVTSLNTLAGGLTLQGTTGQVAVNSNGTNTLTVALDSSVTLQGNSFNGSNQLVKLDGSGHLPALNASALTNLNASSLASGTVPTGTVSGAYTGITQVGTLSGLNVTGTGAFSSTVSGADAVSSTDFVTLSQLTGAVGGISDVSSLNSLTGGLTLQGTSGHVSVSSNGTDTLTLDLDSSVTLQGNSFNGSNQLVQLDGSGHLPALNGSALTTLNASNLTSGNVSSSLISGAYGGITDVGTLTSLSVSGGGSFGSTVSGSDAVSSGDFVTLSQLNTAIGGVGSGVATVGTIDTGTYSADGASISGTSIFMQSATATHVGLVTTSAQTFGGDKTFAGNVVLSTGKTLTITGDITANRPASPTEGMLYYDTTTKKLLVYANGKWQADRSASTVIVGTSVSGGASGAVASVDADGADYVNTSTTSAQTVINSALSSLPATGGTVYLMEGTYIIDGSVSIPNNVKLTGSGSGTVIKIKNSAASAVKAITNTDTSTGTGIAITNLTLDGNKANAAVGGQVGVYMVGMGSGSGSSAKLGASVSNVVASSFNQDGFLSSSSSNGSYTNDTAQNNDNDGFNLGGSYNVIATSNLLGNGRAGVELQNDSNQISNDNFVANGTYGVVFNGVSNNTVSGSRFQDSGGSTTNNAIYLAGSSLNNVTSNFISDSSASSNNFAITLTSGTSSTNYFADNLLTSGTINDLGSNTIFGGQLSGSGAYVIQNSGGINLNGGTTVTGNLTQTGGAVSLQANAASVISTSSGNLSLDAAGTLQLGVGTTGAVTIGKTGITTTIQGSTSVTLQTSTSTTVVCSNAGVLSTCDTSVLSPTATNFIQNQNSITQTGTFKINGTGTAATFSAGTSVLTPLLDTASAGILSIGTTNATEIDLNQNVLVAAGKNLSFAAGAGNFDMHLSTGTLQTGTGAISLNGNTTLAAGKTITVTGDTYTNIAAIGTPTEGMTTYDTTNKQLLTYSNGKWKASSQNAIVVAASNSSQADKNAADYVATGTADQGVINSALTAADPAGSGRKTGKVVLLAGTYTTTDVISVPNNVTLAGEGSGTFIQFANLAGVSKNLITNTTTGGSGTGVVIRDLAVDGNKATNSTGSVSGIYLNGVGDGSTVAGGTVTNVTASNFVTYGIYTSATYGSTFSSNTLFGNGTTTPSVTGAGIYITGNKNNISNNISYSNVTYGIVLNGSLYDNVSNNNVYLNSKGGILLNGNSSDNVITGNNIYNNGGSVNDEGIIITGTTGSSDNLVSNNHIIDSQCTSTCYAIDINSSFVNRTYLSNNTFNTTTTDSINDQGTGTIYAGQIKDGSTNDYYLQPAGTIQLNAATTVTGNLIQQTGTFSLTGSGASTLAVTSGGLTIDTTTTAGQTIAIGNSNITHTVQIGTASGSAQTISIGSSNASSTLGLTAGAGITLNSNTTLAAGKTITVTGDTYTNIAAIGSPTEGMTTYDTTNKQLLTYSNGKWKASSQNAIVVAANNSSQADKNAADYVATGTADQGIINTALTAADPAGAGRLTGKVILLAGTYNTTNVISVPNNVTLSGEGAGTLIKLSNVGAANRNMITNTTTGGSGIGVTIRDLALDGNNGVNTGTDYGILFNGMGANATNGGMILNVSVSNMADDGIHLTSSFNTVINGNILNGNGNNGIFVAGSKDNVVNNISNSSTNFGIVLSGSSYSNVTGNNINSNKSGGIELISNASDNDVSGNTIENNGGNPNDEGIFVTTGSGDNVIANNHIDDTACSSTCYAIDLSATAGTRNYLAANSFDTSPLESINDLASGTMYGGQLNGSSVYVIQNSSGIALNSPTSITNTTATTSLNISTNTTPTTAAIVVNDTSGTTTDKLISLQASSTPKFTVDAAGNVVAVGSLTANSVNSTTGYSFNSTAGTTTTCTGGFILQNPVVQGGILTGGSCTGNGSGGQVTLQASTPGSVDTGNFNISGTGIAAIFSGSTSVNTPLVDAISAGTLSIGTSTATAINISKSGAITSVKGALSVAQSTTFLGDVLAGGSSGANSNTAFRIQNTSNTSLLTADTSGMTITIGGTNASYATLTLNDAHFKVTQTTAPTNGSIASCGTGATMSIGASSTDNAGLITVTTGSTSPAGCTFNLQYHSAYGSTPKSIVLTATTDGVANAASAARQPYISTNSTSGFAVTLNSTGATGTTYSYYYWVVQ